MPEENSATSATTSRMAERNVDTVSFKVLKPIQELEGLSEFRYWPWGLTFGWIVGLGPIITNKQVQDWEKEGFILRTGKKDVSKRTPLQDDAQKPAERPASPT